MILAATRRAGRFPPKPPGELSMPGGAEEERGVIIATSPEGRRESAKTFGQMPEEVLRRAEEEGREPNSAEKVLLK